VIARAEPGTRSARVAAQAKINLRLRMLARARRQHVVEHHPDRRRAEERSERKVG
jgi:hypothetical protein